MILPAYIADQIAAASARIGKNAAFEDRAARVREELAEVEKEVAGNDYAAAEKEMGDLLLSVALLCQGFPWRTSPMAMYASSAHKIARRLEVIEDRMAAGATRDAAIAEAKALYP